MLCLPSSRRWRNVFKILIHVFEQAHQKGPFDLRKPGHHLLLKMADGLWDNLLKRLPFHSQFHNDQSSVSGMRMFLHESLASHPLNGSGDRRGFNSQSFSYFPYHQTIWCLPEEFEEVLLTGVNSKTLKLLPQILPGSPCKMREHL